MSAKIDCIDNAKAITLLLVLIGHSLYTNLANEYGGFVDIVDTTNVCFSYKLISLVIGIIYLFHMPCFMCISGMCFALGSSRKDSFSLFVRKKMKRLLIPFIIACLFVTIPVKYMSGYWDGYNHVIEKIITGQIFLLGISHLWYVWALFWLSLFAYVILPHLSRRYIYIYIYQHFT